jgi:hypothetical protein
MYRNLSWNTNDESLSQVSCVLRFFVAFLILTCVLPDLGSNFSPLKKSSCCCIARLATPIIIYFFSVAIENICDG